MDESPTLKIALVALSAKSYGGTSYFDGLLPALNKCKENFECTFFASEDAFEKFCRGEEYPQIKRYPVPEGLSGWRRIIWEQMSLPRILRSLDVDVVYTAVNLGILYSPKPCVVAIRNMEPLVKANPNWSLKSKIRHFLLHYFTVLSARRAKRVIAVSDFVKDAIEKKGINNTKIDVIYHGIDDLKTSTAALDISVHSGSGFVFSAAKFIRYANLETLFKAFAHLVKLGYQGDLRFAGGAFDKDYEQEIRSLITELNIEDRIRFLGYIPREEMLKNLKTCEVLLFSSTLEACPFTLLEAMQQGAAIIATTANPMPEFCQDAALYVSPKDFESMASEAWRLIGNLEVQNLLRQKAQVRSEFFTWEKNVSQLFKTLEAAACES